MKFLTFKIRLLPASLAVIYLLAGCQSLGEHFNCMAEVDRTVPAQIQQKFVRTDTKCVKSNEQTYQITGGYTGKVYNPGQGDINCSSVPIYENVVLNQPQRDAAYQQCRVRTNNTSYTSGQAMSAPSTREITVPDKERRMYCLKTIPFASNNDYYDKLNKCIGQ